MITIIGKKEDIQKRIADFQRACPDLKVIEVKNHFDKIANLVNGMYDFKFNGKCTIVLDYKNSEHQ